MLQLRMPRVEHHASPDSLLGQLQRGRGEGYLRILSIPKQDACELLLDCICNDPRLDSQVESRAEYDASIAMELELDLAPLANHLHEQDDIDQGWNTPLAVQTLSELAKRGYRDAALILCDYVEWGQWWDWDLDNLMALPNLEIQANVARAIERRFSTDERLEEALVGRWLEEVTWLTLSRHSQRIAGIKEKGWREKAKAGMELSPVAHWTSLSTKQLLELADNRTRHHLRKLIVQTVSPSEIPLLMDNVSLANPFVADIALTGLAHLAPDGIFGWIREFWSTHPEMPYFLRDRFVNLIVSLSPALTMPMAREMLFHENEQERFLAEELFEAHAVSEDIPILRSALKQSLEDDAEFSYRLCTLTDAFAKLPGAGYIPELSDVFIQFRYSYGRIRSAKAMSITSPDFFRDHFAKECLWDCESETRAVGAKFARLGDNASFDRVHKLASNPFEEEEVRAEAGKRLRNNPHEPHVTI